MKFHIFLHYTSFLFCFSEYGVYTLNRKLMSHFNFLPTSIVETFSNFFDLRKVSKKYLAKEHDSNFSKLFYIQKNFQKFPRQRAWFKLFQNFPTSEKFPKSSSPKKMVQTFPTLNFFPKSSSPTSMVQTFPTLEKLSFMYDLSSTSHKQEDSKTS